ncbi:peptidoglycan binding protein CsiV [Psychromonas sp.]|nr:peptidoglycan binding protein CsiV [Psychromonas sp.]
MNFRYILPFIIAVSCSLNTQAAPSDRWFEVELLVFKRNVDVQTIGEQLDQNDIYLKQRERLEVFKAEPAIDCLPDSTCLHEQNPVQITYSQIVRGGHRLELLDTSYLQLKEQATSLTRHSAFNPLMHAVWRMPVQNKQNALPIHLFAGENYALDLYKEEILELQKQQSYKSFITSESEIENNSQTITNIQSKEELELLAEVENKNIIQDLYEIDGNLLIYVEHYLHVESQLIVRTETEKTIRSNKVTVMETEVTDSENSQAVEVVAQESIIPVKAETKTVVTETLFDQNRRLRSEEIHYLDHPLFGIIIQIRKIPKDQLPQE